MPTSGRREQESTRAQRARSGGRSVFLLPHAQQQTQPTTQIPPSLCRTCLAMTPSPWSHSHCCRMVRATSRFMSRVKILCWQRADLSQCAALITKSCCAHPPMHTPRALRAVLRRVGDALLRRTRAGTIPSIPGGRWQGHGMACLSCFLPQELTAPAIPPRRVSSRIP